MVVWFSISMVDHLLKSQWSTTSSGARGHIREVLFRTLCARQAALPDFVSKSLANLIVRIAVRDWPHDDPTFLQRTLAALGQPQHWYVLLRPAMDPGLTRLDSIAALLLYQQMAEEFAPSQIKLLPADLEKALSNIKGHLPELMNTLQAFLEHQLTYVQQGAFTDPSQQKKAMLGLEALIQFLVWIPLSEILSPAFMKVLFGFIHLPNDGTSLAAFSCVNEILAQNFVPKEFAEFMVTVFKELFLLLQKLTQSKEGLGQVEEE